MPSIRSSTWIRAASSVLVLATAGGGCVEPEPELGATADEVGLTPLRVTFAGDPGGDDTCHAIASRTDTSFVVTGELRRIVQGHNAVIRGYNGGGNLTWSREINTPSEGHDRGNDVVALADNTSISAGLWSSGASGDNAFLTRTSSAGGSLWWRESTAPGDDEYRGVAVDGAGAVYVTGVKAGSGGQAWLRKLSADGATQLWEDVRDGTSAGSLDAANKVGVDGSGNVYVVGFVDNSATGTGLDGYLSKFSPTGTWLANTWIWSYANDAVLDVAVATDGSLAVVAQLDGAHSVRKYDAAGALVWATTDAAVTWRGVALDVNGAVYATGSQGTSMMTVKLAAADGALVWSRLQPGAAGHGVTIDGAGRTLVCGEVTAAGGGTDGLIMRYPF